MVDHHVNSMTNDFKLVLPARIKTNFLFRIIQTTKDDARGASNSHNLEQNWLRQFIIIKPTLLSFAPFTMGEIIWSDVRAKVPFK